MNEQPLLELFEKHKFAYTIHKHKPAFTVREAQDLYGSMPGAHCKTLFLKDKKKTFYLVSILHHKRADLKELSKLLQTSGFSFGNAEELDRLLRVIPGSVTPYGLVFDSEKKISLILDAEILKHEFVNFHPLRNDQTLSLRTEHFLKFLELVHNRPRIWDIPTQKGLGVT